MATTENPAGEGASQSQDSTRSFFETAQEAIGDAVEATVEAVKENPLTAAAIAAGAAVAVGGAAYAASQLLGDKDDTAPGGAKK